MIYQSDYSTFPVHFQPRYDYRRSFRKSKSEAKINFVAPLSKIDESEEDIDDQKSSDFKSWFLDFCENTSIHGVKFIGQPGLHWSER